MTGWVVVNGVLEFNGSLTISGVVATANATGDVSQVVTAAHTSYVPGWFDVATGQSLTIEDTAIFEVG